MSTYFLLQIITDLFYCIMVLLIIKNYSLYQIKAHRAAHENWSKLVHVRERYCRAFRLRQSQQYTIYIVDGGKHSRLTATNNRANRPGQGVWTSLRESFRCGALLFGT